jgi:peptidoglycan/xylan/chitin deacetylase (PgdA/CDA1 family)
MSSQRLNKMPSAGRPPVIVSTSWDDDSASGLKIAELLSARGLPGTFYVPTLRLGEGPVFSGADLRTLSANGFEIGAHTISHRILTELEQPELIREVAGCKEMLQQILGKEVTTFCYPKGRFNARVVREVERAGYRGARSTQILFSGSTFPPYEMPTTVQAYPHRRSNYVRNLIRLRAISALVNSAPDLISFENWLQLGKSLFDRVLHDGGTWHLYGHPWEIENLNLWAQVEEILDYVSRRESVTYLNNGEILERLNPKREADNEKIVGSRERSLVN